MNVYLPSCTRPGAFRLRAPGYFLAIWIAGLAACAPFLGDETPRGSTAERLHAALTDAVAPGCEPTLFTVDDLTGQFPPWLDATADTARRMLRARGTPLLRARHDVNGPWLALVRTPGGGLRLERREALGATTLRQLAPGDADSPDGARFAGRRRLEGPALPWEILALRPARSGRVRVETSHGTRTLVLDIHGNGLRARRAPPAPPDLAEAPRRATGPGIFRLPDPPGPLADLSLRAIEPLAGTRDGFVALDAWGAVLYGTRQALFGPPATGHGGGLAALDGLFVTATDALPGRPDTLVAYRMTASRSLVVAERHPLGGAGVRALAASDLDADGVDELIVALAIPGGTRLVAFADREGPLP